MPAEIHLTKAEKALSAAKLLLDASDSDGACDRAYFAILQAAQAASIKAGDRVPTIAINSPVGLVSNLALSILIPEHLVETFGGTLQTVEALRMTADYGGASLAIDEAHWAFEQATVFVSTIRMLT